MRRAKTLLAIAKTMVAGWLAIAPVAGLAVDMEADSAVISDTFGAAGDFTTVNFRQTFSSVPVVFATATSDGGQPCALRIVSVTTTSFDATCVEPDNLDGAHVAMTVHYFAIEAGQHYLTDDLGDEYIIIAGTHDTQTVQHGTGVGGAEGWDAITYWQPDGINDFIFGSSPIVLAQLQTDAHNGIGTQPMTTPVPWLTATMQSVTTTDFEVALERSEVNSGSVTTDETIGWVAIQGGLDITFTVGATTIRMETILSGAAAFDGWDDGCDNVSFSTINSANRLAIAKKRTHAGGDGGWLRRCAISNTSVGLTVDEDQFLDAERNHIGEQASILVFSEAFDTSALATNAQISAFGAYRSAATGSVVEWKTVSEQGTLGFHLERYDATSGQFVRVNDWLLPALPHAYLGGTYRFTDLTADTGEVNRYRLVEVPMAGRPRVHGPYRVIASVEPPRLDHGSAVAYGLGVGTIANPVPFADSDPTVAGIDDTKVDDSIALMMLGADDALVDRVAGITTVQSVLTPAGEDARRTDRASDAATLADPVYLSVPNPASPAQTARKVRAANAREAQLQRRVERRGPRAKIAVAQGGLHHVDSATLAARLGSTESEVRNQITGGGIAIRHRGSLVDTVAGPDGSGLYFYADKIDSQYSDEDVYWVEVGEGSAMRTRRPGGPDLVAAVAGLAFESTVGSSGDKYALTHLFDDPDADYWMWDFRLGGFTFPDCEVVEPPMPCNISEFPVTAPDSVKSAPAAVLTVRLHGATDADHRVTVALNGTAVGNITWRGAVPHTGVLTVDSALLAVEGDNLVSIDAAPSSNPYLPSVVYVNDFELRYSRLYRAVENRLLAPAAGHEELTIAGFESADVWVLDVSDPRRPVRLESVLVEATSDGYRASFRRNRDGAKGRYLALTVGAAVSVISASVVADVASELRKSSHRIDYLIITRSDMVEVATALAEHRAENPRYPLRSLVVDIEDVYDEFNHGVPSPEAIWRFLRFAHLNWDVSPRYVLLAGEGSYDYKNRLGHGDSVVPSLLAPTPYGLYPSDFLYADVAGNDWGAGARGRPVAGHRCGRARGDDREDHPPRERGRRLDAADPSRRGRDRRRRRVLGQQRAAGRPGAGVVHHRTGLYG